MLHRSFKKVRVGGKIQQNNEVLDAMKNKQKLLKDKEENKEKLETNPNDATLLHSKHKNEDDIEEADDKIADLIAEKNVRLITEHFEQLSGSSGAFSLTKMWNLKKRIRNQREERRIVLPKAEEIFDDKVKRLDLAGYSKCLQKPEEWESKRSG